VGGVFINYRNGEHSAAVEALHHVLADHFGESQVFLDRRSIAAGTRYPDALRHRVHDCEVLVAVIHPQWLTARDEQGRRLIDREGDWVRTEIEIALDAGKPVIPLLLGGAGRPVAEELPESIRDVARRQAHQIRPGSFGPDVSRLTRRLELAVAPTWVPPGVPAGPVRSEHHWGMVAGIALMEFLAVATPVLAVGEHESTDEVPWTLMAAVVSAFVVAGMLLVAAVVYVTRRKIDSLERELQAVASARYHTRLMLPALIFVMLVVVAPSVTSGDDGSGTLFMLAGGFVGVLYAGRLMLRQERFDEAPDPQPLPPGSRPWARRAVARLQEQLDQTTTPLSRERRDKARWTLDQISGAAAYARKQASQGRIRWLVSYHPVASTASVLCTAGTTGLLLATLLGPPATTVHYRHPLAPAIFLLAVLGLFRATLEIEYRHARWQHLVFAAEADEHVAELSKRLRRDDPSVLTGAGDGT
jgi:hypothetical protein